MDNSRIYEIVKFHFTKYKPPEARGKTHSLQEDSNNEREEVFAKCNAWLPNEVWQSRLSEYIEELTEIERNLICDGENGYIESVAKENLPSAILETIFYVLKGNSLPIEICELVRCSENVQAIGNIIISFPILYLFCRIKNWGFRMQIERRGDLSGGYASATCFYDLRTRQHVKLPLVIINGNIDDVETKRVLYFLERYSSVESFCDREYEFHRSVPMLIYQIPSLHIEKGDSNWKFRSVIESAMRLFIRDDVISQSFYILFSKGKFYAHSADDSIHSARIDTNLRALIDGDHVSPEVEISDPQKRLVRRRLREDEFIADLCAFLSEWRPLTSGRDPRIQLWQELRGKPQVFVMDHRFLPIDHAKGLKVVSAIEIEVMTIPIADGILLCTVTLGVLYKDDAIFTYIRTELKSRYWTLELSQGEKDFVVESILSSLQGEGFSNEPQKEQIPFPLSLLFGSKYEKQLFLLDCQHRVFADMDSCCAWSKDQIARQIERLVL